MHRRTMPMPISAGCGVGTTAPCADPTHQLTRLVVGQLLFPDTRAPGVDAQHENDPRTHERTTTSANPPRREQNVSAGPVPVGVIGRHHRMLTCIGEHVAEHRLIGGVIGVALSDSGPKPGHKVCNTPPARPPARPRAGSGAVLRCMYSPRHAGARVTSSGKCR
jgi:hypothetical protein